MLECFLRENKKQLIGVLCKSLKEKIEKVKNTATK